MWIKYSGTDGMSRSRVVGFDSDCLRSDSFFYRMKKVAGGFIRIISKGGYHHCWADEQSGTIS